MWRDVDLAYQAGRISPEIDQVKRVTFIAVRRKECAWLSRIGVRGTHTAIAAVGFAFIRCALGAVCRGRGILFTTAAGARRRICRAAPCGKLRKLQCPDADDG